jgi:hypothetical protein
MCDHRFGRHRPRELGETIAERDVGQDRHARILKERMIA